METTLKQQSEAREERAKLILERGSPETLDEYISLNHETFRRWILKFGKIILLERGMLTKL